jgi:hypothetical protein
MDAQFEFVALVEINNRSYAVIVETYSEVEARRLINIEFNHFKEFRITHISRATRLKPYV